MKQKLEKFAAWIIIASAVISIFIYFDIIEVAKVLLAIACVFIVAWAFSKIVY